MVLTCRSKWKQLKRLMGKCSHAFILQTYLHLRGSPRGVGTWASQALWRVSFLDELLGLVPRLWDCLAAPFSSGTGSQGGPPTSLGNREERRVSLCSPSATHTHVHVDLLGICSLGRERLLTRWLQTTCHLPRWKGVVGG